MVQNFAQQTEVNAISLVAAVFFYVKLLKI